MRYFDAMRSEASSSIPSLYNNNNNNNNNNDDDDDDDGDDDDDDDDDDDNNVYFLYCARFIQICSHSRLIKHDIKRLISIRTTCLG